MRVAQVPAPSIAVQQGGDGSQDLRNPSRLLRELTDLFISRRDPSAIEIMRFEDIACKLAENADGAALAYTAARVCSHPHAPVILIDTLIQQSNVSAKILVEHCARVSPRHLLHFAMHDDPALASAVARRRKLTPAMALALAERTEISVLRDLATNPQVELRGALLTRLVTAARKDIGLAKLLASKATDPIAAAPLFLHAGPELKKAILTAAEQQTFDVEDIKSVRLIGPAIINWLLRRDPEKSWERIAAELARLLHQPLADIEALILDRQGDGLALAFAAVGMPGPEAVRFLLRCRPEISHSCERIRTLGSIIEGIPAHAARKLISRIVTNTSEEAQHDHRQEPESKRHTVAMYQPLHDTSAAALPGRVTSSGRAKPVGRKPEVKNDSIKTAHMG